MNDNKSNYYTQQILKAFLENDMVTNNQLASEIGLSEKTIRTKIDAINTMLMENGLGEICKKPRIGMWLNADEYQRSKILMNITSSNRDVIQNDQTRMIAALRRILKMNRTTSLTTRQLADSLYLSVPTALKVINDCKDWLKIFSIDLNIIRNKGLELECSEVSYRLALKNFIMKMENTSDIDASILYFMPGLNLNLIRKSIISTEKEWGFNLADESFNEILIYSCMSVFECMQDKRKSLQISKSELKTLSQYSEYRLAEMVFKKITETMDLEIPVEDIAFLSIQILCARMIDQGYNGTGLHTILEEYDSKLEAFVKKIIDVVSNVTNVDLTNDEELYRGLLLHLRPMIFRMKYERTYTNELTGYIKSELKQTLRISWLISVLFEEDFGLKITEDELSYIALYIQSALDRNSAPITAVLVSNASMGINQMICDKLKRSCDELKTIRVSSMHDFNIRDCEDVNLIITTKHLYLEDPRIVEISDWLNDAGVNKVKEKIRQINYQSNEKKVHFDAACHQLFEPDLIFVHQKVKDKAELLNLIGKKLVKKGYVTNKYIQTVFDRENITPTSIGNGVAIPHGDQNEINEAKVAIATLQEPILWDSEKVDVVFLLVVKMSNEFEANRTQMFYKQYIKLVDSDEKVNILRSIESNVDFYTYLVQ